MLGFVRVQRVNNCRQELHSYFFLAMQILNPLRYFKASKIQLLAVPYPTLWSTFAYVFEMSGQHYSAPQNKDL